MDMKKRKLLFALNNDLYKRMFSERDLDRIKSYCERINDDVPESVLKEWLLEHSRHADIIITSWGTPCIDGDILAESEELRMIAHAGGSVKPVTCEAVWERDIRVTSAAAAIGYGVAEYCLGLMLTACKRAFWLAHSTRENKWHENTTDFGGWFELYQQEVGVIGAGHVGRHLIRLLGNFECDVLVYDPYLSAEEASHLGARKVETLEEMFSRARAISLNAPTTESTKGMLRGEHFALLKPGSLFINTARAALIREEEFVRELEKGHFVACMDVTEVEPPPPEHPFRHLPNVALTPHIAGAVAENQLRMGTFVTDEIENFCQDKPAIYGVSLEDLKRLA